jgi:hypothetical protein
MPTLRRLLDNAGITASELSRLSNVDYRTTRKAIEGSGPVKRVKVLAFLRVLNQRIGSAYTPEDIEGTQIQ